MQTQKYLATRAWDTDIPLYLGNPPEIRWTIDPHAAKQFDSIEEISALMAEEPHAFSIDGVPQKIKATLLTVHIGLLQNPL